MQLFETRNFGRISYEPDSVLQFPGGLPGFEQSRSFLPVQVPDTDPIVFLQNLEDPALCFVTLPVLTIAPDYQLDMGDTDLEAIGFSPGSRPRIGEDVLCLTIVSIRPTGPTANLLAPVVVNLRSRSAVQAVATELEYSHQYELVPQEALACS